MGSDITYPCNVCGLSTSHWCSRCQKVWYCTNDHLQQDWPRHQGECVPASVIPPPVLDVVPVSNGAPAFAVSALFLSPHEDRPSIVSVKCFGKIEDSRTGCPSPGVQPFFPGSTPASIVLTQGLNQEPLRFPLQLWYCPSALSRGSPSNKAVYRITSGKMSKSWSGPVLVLKFAGSRRQKYTDATTHDLGTLAAYFISLR